MAGLVAVVTIALAYFGVPRWFQAKYGDEMFDGPGRCDVKGDPVPPPDAFWELADKYMLLLRLPFHDALTDEFRSAVSRCVGSIAVGCGRIEREQDAQAKNQLCRRWSPSFPKLERLTSNPTVRASLNRWWHLLPYESFDVDGCPSLCKEEGKAAN